MTKEGTAVLIGAILALNRAIAAKAFVDYFLAAFADKGLAAHLVFARVAVLETVTNTAMGNRKVSLLADVSVVRDRGTLLYALREGIGRRQAVATLNRDQRIARRVNQAAPDAPVRFVADGVISRIKGSEVDLAFFQVSEHLLG